MKLEVIATRDELTYWRARVFAAMCETFEVLTQQMNNPAELMWAMKFQMVGKHPIEDRPLNVIEQINQTWSYLTALKACELLLEWHPDMGGFHVAPGAHARTPYDIQSVVRNGVAAEIFAATHPRSNNKLNKDLNKLELCEARHRYEFFGSPAFPNTERLPQFERSGIRVWSLKMDEFEADG